MSVQLVVPASPYKGLSAFDDAELDALLFFGRERERAVIVANLLSSRLTVLYGETGVGKSSILRAGVVRELREVAPSALVVLRDTWTDDPAAALADVRNAFEAYVILDQFEEYFVYHDHASGRGTLLEALPELLRPQTGVNVLISLREDVLGALDVFKAVLPNVFANQLRLDRLDRDAARTAILGPVSRWNELAGEEVAVEPELVEAVLDQVATGRVDLGQAGVGTIDGGGGERRIEAPYLQLVMERIWAAERAEGSDTLRATTLRALGGAETIVRDHVENALDELDGAQKDAAARMFDHLVTPSGTKIAHRARDLAQYAAAPEEALAPVLSTLNRERILRTVDAAPGDGERYEIFHDALAEPVLAWRARRQLERERSEASRRHRRLLALAVASLVALGAVGVVAVFALTQRSQARSEARHAHAGELAATALATLGHDPFRSLQLALSAARIERNPRIEDVLRTALTQSRLRLVVPVGGPVTGAAFSPDGRRIIVGGRRNAGVYAVGSGRRLLWVRAPGRVTAASFSPDGRRILVADAGGHVLLRAAGGTATALVLRQPAAVEAAVFGANGSVVATGADDGSARLWNARNGRSLGIFRLDAPVTAVAVTREGRRLAAVAGGRAALYDTSTGRLVRTPFDDVTAIAFSRDGSLLVTASPGTARLWRTVDGAFITAFPHGGAVTAVEFSPDGRRLLTAAGDGALRVWDLATGARLLLIPSGTNVVESAHYSADGTLIVAGGSDGVAHVWNSANGRELVALTGHRDVVTDARFSPNGRLVLTASSDGSARVWDIGPLNRPRLLGRAAGAIVDVGFGDGGRVAAAGSRGGSATVWDVGTGRRLRAVRAPVPLDDAQLDADGSSLATVGDDGAARVWPVRASRGPAVLANALPGRVVEFSADGGTLLVAGGYQARLFDAGSHRVIATLPAGGRIVDARFGAGDRLVVTATARGRVRVWDPDGSLLRTIDTRAGRVAAVAVSSDGTIVATAGADGVARTWSVRRGRPRHALRIPEGPLTDVEFSGDGRYVIAAGEREARVWTVADGELVHVLRGHHGRVASVAFSPDDRWILTSGPTAVGLWNTSTGHLLFYLRGGRAQVEKAVFSPDDEHVLAGSADGSVRVYDCQVCGTVYQLARLARARLTDVTSMLTPEQRGRYFGG